MAKAPTNKPAAARKPAAGPAHTQGAADPSGSAEPVSNRQATGDSGASAGTESPATGASATAPGPAAGANDPAASAAGPSGAGTEGGARTSSGSGAPAATSTPPAGTGAASVASAAPVTDATVTDAPRDWEAEFGVLIGASRAAYIAQAEALERLFDHAMAGLPGAAARTLAALADARAALKVMPAEVIAHLENRARDDEAHDDEAGAVERFVDSLVELEVRSRDGKPYRRAGLPLGDAFERVRVTKVQAQALRADRVGVQIKGER